MTMQRNTLMKSNIETYIGVSHKYKWLNNNINNK